MRDMSNLTHEQAKSNGWEILVPLKCEVVGKATFQDNGQEIMKSTKRFKVPGGWVYNTSTEMRNNSDGTIAIAEALAFVPEVEKGGNAE